MQAALAVGCRAIGVECASHRHNAAGVLRTALLKRLSADQGTTGGPAARLRNCSFLLGDILDLPMAILSAITHFFLFDTVRADPAPCHSCPLLLSPLLVPRKNGISAGHDPEESPADGRSASMPASSPRWLSCSTGAGISASS